MASSRSEAPLTCVCDYLIPERGGFTRKTTWGEVNRLIAAACAIGMAIVAWREPWLTAADPGGIAAMDGTGAWTFAGQAAPTAEAHGWAMQYTAMAGAALILAGALTQAATARLNRILLGSVCAAATALTALIATNKISGLPDTHGVVIQTGSAPKVVLALSVVAAITALIAPVPVAPQAQHNAAT